MYRTLLRAGGGGGYHYPKHIWTPSGGWWPTPHRWERNTTFTICGIGTLFGIIFAYSTAQERRPVNPKN